VNSALALFAGANVVYATSYVATRFVLDDVPPTLLAMLRLLIGAAVLLPLGRGKPVPAAPHRLFWMGALGFAAAFALANWGIRHSSATNAALLIVVEPVALLALGPMLLGERLTRREVFGAITAVLGAVVVVFDGVPGVTERVLPHWRGDLLLVLSGLAYASYSLLGRTVLTDGNATAVTARSIAWGAAVMAPLAAFEWATGARPALTASAIGGTLYLGFVITAGGYLVWNVALARVQAARAAPFLTIQSVVGALLGWAVLGEPASVFTLIGGALVVAGLWMTVTGRR
jgi:drug/metabolite transporter (DMT)-like permease